MADRVINLPPIPKSVVQEYRSGIANAKRETHKNLSTVGIQRTVGGSKLGLRKRLAIAEFRAKAIR